VSDTGSQATENTSRGDLTLTWATNGWVMVDLAGRSDQRQIGSKHDLAELLSAVGISTAEAEREAETLWRRRPKDAAAEGSRPNQELWRTTGLPAWAIGLIVLGLIALYILYRVVDLRP
jgi:hypothetical protein